MQNPRRPTCYYRGLSTSRASSPHARKSLDRTLARALVPSSSAFCLHRPRLHPTLALPCPRLSPAGRVQNADVHTSRACRRASAPCARHRPSTAASQIAPAARHSTIRPRKQSETTHLGVLEARKRIPAELMRRRSARARLHQVRPSRKSTPTRRPPTCRQSFLHRHAYSWLPHPRCVARNCSGCALVTAAQRSLVESPYDVAQTRARRPRRRPGKPTFRPPPQKIASAQLLCTYAGSVRTPDRRWTVARPVTRPRSLAGRRIIEVGATASPNARPATTVRTVTQEPSRSNRILGGASQARSRRSMTSRTANSREERWKTARTQTIRRIAHAGGGGIGRR